MVQNPAFWGFPDTYFNFLKFLFFIYLYPPSPFGGGGYTVLPLSVKALLLNFESPSWPGILDTTL
jgi:hypothetical protein